ncbi:MAG: acetoacetate decarboxylase family protein [Acidimicrobiales bacterium]
MPRFGTLDLAAALADAPAVGELADGPHWELPEATLVQINWEVADEPALAITPQALHPSIPPYLSFFAGRYPDSPVGAFTLVQMRLVVRAGIRPRGFCLGAVCDSEEATEALRANWGYPVVRGEASVSVRHDRVEVAAAVGGRDVVRAKLVHPETIGGSDLMPFDNLHLVTLPDGDPAIVQIDPEYAIHSADRGTPYLELPDPNALGMRGGIRLDRAIIGFSFKADTDLAPVRFAIDPTKPATQGTRRLNAPAKA